MVVEHKIRLYIYIGREMAKYSVKTLITMFC